VKSKLVLAVLLAATALAACSSGSKSADNPTLEAPSTTAPATATSTTSAAVPSTQAWTAYDHDAARSGVADDQSPIGQVHKAWETAALDGEVYGQPLVVGGHVLAATEANSVYAFDAATGAQLWRVQLGAPVKGGTLPCGNIDPSGITGTPVIDPASNTLYAVAFLANGTHHELFALDVASGATRWHRAIDPPGLAGRVEQERGALTISSGRVYVPFGGLFGDCGGYKGAVVSSALNGQGDLTSYLVPTRREAGIWHPGGPAVDGAGDLWVSTGNSESTGPFDYGNAVVHLSPQLQAVDYFAPTNWLRLNQGDVDLGSIGPALVGTNRVLAGGKQGIAYLLDRGRLGNIGGSITQIQACGGEVFGTAAVQGTTVFMPCTDALVAITTAGDKVTQTWRRSGAAGPPIVAAGLVWDLANSGTLVALDPASGQQRFSQQLDTPPASRFVSLSAADGKLFVAPKNTIKAFALR
jgi:outer membrane protein assembly factor BamB